MTTLLDSITYYVSQTIGVCESVERDSVNVKLRDSDKPTLKNPGITMPLVFCSYPRPLVDTLKNYVLGNNLKYYTDSIKGKAINAQDSLKTGTYYISQKPEGKCESSKRLAISVVVGDTSQPNLSEDTLFFCPGSNPVVSNLSSGNLNLIWYDASTSNTALSTNAALSSGMMYYASQIGKTCESSLRDSVLVIFKSPETPQGSTTAKFCASAKPKISDLTPKGSNIKWYLFSSGTDSLDLNFPLENGRTYYAANKVGDCESSRLDVTVTLEDPKATLSITSKTAVCEGKQATIEIENPQQGTTYNVYSNFNSNTAVGTAPYSFTPVNDTIYYIQASNSNGCVQSNKTPILIRVNKNPNAPTAITSSLKVCKSTALILNATSGQPNVSFSWTGPNGFKSTDAKVTVTSNPDSTFDGNYYVSVVDKNTGCVSLKNDTVTVKVIDVQAGFTPSSTIGFIPAKLTFTNTSVNAVSYYWNFRDGSESKEVSPEHVFEKEGVYQVYLVAYRENCRDTAYMGDLEIGRPSRISVPNVFTPNDDNVNDVFKIKGDGLKYVSAKIFNRWGQLVYEWDSIGGSWNGTTLAGVNAADGTYFYVIVAKGNDDKPYTLKGYVDLIR